MKLTLKKSVQVDEEVEVEFPLFRHHADGTEGWWYDYFVRINEDGRTLALKKTSRGRDVETEVEVSYTDIKTGLSYYMNSYNAITPEEFARELGLFTLSVQEITT